MVTVIEQIKIDGKYYNASPEDRELLRNAEGNLIGSVTPEGVIEFDNLINEVRSRSQLRDFEFDVYCTSAYLEANPEPGRHIPPEVTDDLPY